VVTPLSAGNPLVAITARARQAAAGDAAGAAAVASGGIELTAGNLTGVGTQNALTVAGIAAVLSALNTYYAALTTAQKAQIGRIEVQVTPAGLRCQVRQADAASFTTTLATALNNTSNFGPVGT
jgi:hypothetical protein